MHPTNHLTFSRFTVTALFLIGMLTFLLLAWRSEINDEHIKDNTARIEAAQYAQCAANRAQLAKFNVLRRDVIALERVNPDPRSPARIEAYTRSLMVLPEC